MSRVTVQVPVKTGIVNVLSVMSVSMTQRMRTFSFILICSHDTIQTLHARSAHVMIIHHTHIHIISYYYELLSSIERSAGPGPGPSTQLTTEPRILSFYFSTMPERCRQIMAVNEVAEKPSYKEYPSKICY